MKTRRNRILVLALSLTALVFTSCVSQKPVMEKVFNEKELHTYNRIIDFYDDFILSHYEKPIEIDDAYQRYISHYGPICEEEGDLSYLKPSDSLCAIFFKTLDTTALNELYFTLDSIRFFDTILKVPYHFSFNYGGKFKTFAKQLSKRKSFYKGYYDGMEKAGDIQSPTTFVEFIYMSHKMNFKNRDERLAFASLFLFRNPMTAYELDENNYKRRKN